MLYGGIDLHKKLISLIRIFLIFCFAWKSWQRKRPEAHGGSKTENMGTHWCPQADFMHPRARGQPNESKKTTTNRKEPAECKHVRGIEN